MTTAPSCPADSDMRWVADYPRHGAQRFPDRVAILADSGSFTYQELEQASERFADYLLSLDLPAESRIAYFGKNSELQFPVLFGCIRAGMTLVPINFRLTAPETAYILQDAGARLLICAPEFEPMLRQAVAQSGQDIPVLLTDTEGKSVDLARLLRTSTATGAPRPTSDPQRCVLQLYTSGTTGRPKGVMLSHHNLTLSRWVEIDSPDWADWTDDDTILSAMPNFHAGGLSWMLIDLLRSLTCILTADPSPQNMLALSQRHHVTRTFMVAPVVRALLDALAASSGPTPRYKTIYYGAAPMDPALIQRCLQVFGCQFAQFFGMTEACGSVTFLPPRLHDLAHPEWLRSVGQPLPGYQIEIRDASGRKLPRGTPGEIWVKSGTIMRGYWRQPQATAEVLVDGWYRTGDGGYLDDSGLLYLTDRIKDIIISGGENVYPVEVETVLRSHPAVKEVVVIARPDEKWGEIVTAVVEWQEGKSATLDELREFARSRLAGYKLPRALEATAMLPRTPTGKLQRAEVRKRHAAAG